MHLKDLAGRGEEEEAKNCSLVLEVKAGEEGRESQGFWAILGFLAVELQRLAQGSDQTQMATPSPSL